MSYEYNVDSLSREQPACARERNSSNALPTLAMTEHRLGYVRLWNISSFNSFWAPGGTLRHNGMGNQKCEWAKACT